MKTFDGPKLAQTLFEEAGDALFLFDPETETIIDHHPLASRLTGFFPSANACFQVTTSSLGGRRRTAAAS